MQRELIIDLATGHFDILPIDHEECIIGPVDYGWAHFSQESRSSHKADPDILTWGGGPLAGSRIPGTRRLVFCSYSPPWEGFYISSFGGGAFIMHRVGVDFVTIKGAAPQDSVLILNHRNGEIEVRLESINPDVIWARYADPDGRPLIGFYALQQAVFDRYSDEYDDDWPPGIPTRASSAATPSKNTASPPSTIGPGAAAWAAVCSSNIAWRPAFSAAIGKTPT